MTDSTCPNCLGQQSGSTIECDFAFQGCAKTFHLSCVNLTVDDRASFEPWTCDLCTTLKNDLAQHLPGGLFGAWSATADQKSQFDHIFDNQDAMDAFVASHTRDPSQMTVPEFLQDLETTANEDALQQGWNGNGNETATGFVADPFDPTGGSLMTSDYAMAEAICATMPQELEELFEAHVHEMDFDSCNQSAASVEMPMRFKQ